MVHICGEAVRRKTRAIEVGHSMHEFLRALGIDPTGDARCGYTMFKKQMEALAACRMTLGMTDGDRDITIDAKPIQGFEAWLQRDGEQPVMWPGVLELSQDGVAWDV